MRWYKIPNYPYEVSADLQVRRLPGKGSPDGRLLLPRGHYYLYGEPGPLHASAPELLNMALTHGEMREEEVWRQHPTLKILEVSDLGRTRLYGTHHPLPQFKYKGYTRVKIGNKPMTLHNLIAETFLPGRPPNAYARHIDGNRDNNQLCNLAWGPPRPPKEETTATPQKKKSKRGPLTPRQLWAMQYGRQRQKKER